MKYGLSLIFSKFLYARTTTAAETISEVNHHSKRLLGARHGKKTYGFSAIISLFFLSLTATSTGSTSADLTAYEVLQSYGFPLGLLPSGVQGYTLQHNGDFVVKLGRSCLVNIPDAYPVKYSSQITGRISYGHLRNLQGITVKVIFWWNIDAIAIIGNDLSFSVGPLSASYPISNFIQFPECESDVRKQSFAVD